MAVEADVLLPAYNAEKTIAEAVGSMQQQTLAAIRIHVVDDGSSDRTAEIVREMAATDPRVLLHKKRNGGIVEALNYGLHHCTAEFIVRHDADDLADHRRLEVQIAYLRQHPDTVGVGAAVRHIDSLGRLTGTIGRMGLPTDADAYAIPSREPYLIHPFLTVRRDALVAAGGYRYVFHAEDTDLYWRLLEAGRLHNLEEVLGSYRIHTESISGTSILNGRIQAISSQLAALSHRRRLSGTDDLGFPKEALAALERAETLDAMVAEVATPLSPDERRWMDAAAGAKLLELAAYRPYEIERSDCLFIGRTVRRGMERSAPAERRRLRRQLMGSAARLASAGRVKDAFAMLTPALVIGFALRWIARTALSEESRRLLRRRSGIAPIK